MKQKEQSVPNGNWVIMAPFLISIIKMCFVLFVFFSVNRHHLEIFLNLLNKLKLDLEPSETISACATVNTSRHIFHGRHKAG